MADPKELQNYGDRFRLTTLQSRFSAFIDLWDRGLRAREEGRPWPFAQRTPAEPKKAPARAEDKVLFAASLLKDGKLNFTARGLKGEK